MACFIIPFSSICHLKNGTRFSKDSFVVLCDFLFYGYAEQTFSAQVYSDVDRNTRTISNYKCRRLKNENIDLGFSQDNIL